MQPNGAPSSACDKPAGCLGPELMWEDTTVLWGGGHRERRPARAGVTARSARAELAHCGRRVQAAVAGRHAGSHPGVIWPYREPADHGAADDIDRSPLASGSWHPHRGIKLVVAAADSDQPFDAAQTQRNHALPPTTYSIAPVDEAGCPP